MFCVFVGCLPGITIPGCKRAGKSRPGGEQQPRTPPGPRSYFGYVYIVYTVYTIKCLNVQWSTGYPVRLKGDRKIEAIQLLNPHF